MRVTITNTSKADQGVHTTDGLKFIPSGETRSFYVDADALKRARGLPFLTITDGDTTDEPVERLWLALADDENGSGFTTIDMSARKFLGFATGPTRPTEIGDYRFEALERKPFVYEPRHVDPQPGADAPLVGTGELIQESTVDTVTGEPVLPATGVTGEVAETFDAELLEAATDEELAEMHEKKFGRPPHHAAKRETIIAKLAAPAGENKDA